MIHIIDDQYIYIRPEGVFDARVLMEIARGLQEIEQERPDLTLRLSDVSAVKELRFSFGDFADYSERRVYPNGEFHCKTAFYVTNDEQYGFARMCQTLIEGPKQEIRVFRDIREAARWLDVPLTPLEERGWVRAPDATA